MPIPAPIPVRSADTAAPGEATLFAAAMVQEHARCRGRLDRVVFLMAVESLCRRLPGLNALAARACVSLAYLGAISQSPELFWRDGGVPTPGEGAGQVAA